MFKSVGMCEQAVLSYSKVIAILKFPRVFPCPFLPQSTPLLLILKQVKAWVRIFLRGLKTNYVCYFDVVFSSLAKLTVITETYCRP